MKATLVKIPREENSKDIFLQQFYDVYVSHSAGTGTLLEAEKLCRFCLNCTLCLPDPMPAFKQQRPSDHKQAAKTKTSISVVKSFFYCYKYTYE